MAQLLLSSAVPIAVELGARTGLGREAGNTLRLEDGTVSSHHCVIEQRGPAYVLADLGSLNGTFVNGQRLAAEQPLSDGDEIQIGATRARFQDVPAPAPARAATTLTQATPALRTAEAVEVVDAPRQIRAEVPTAARGFPAFEAVERDREQLRKDYEELRMMVELTREVASERDLELLLDKVLGALFRFVAAERGTILLATPDGGLRPAASRRRSGSTLPIAVSTTILGHVLRERASVLTPDALQEFAGSMGKSVALNRISSAIVVPLLHEGALYGAVWLDSEFLAQFSVDDLELVTAVANQAALFIANALLGKQVERETHNRERLSRLLSPNVAEQIIRSQIDVTQGGIYVPSCTVFNSDIRGFTRMSEGIAPELMIDMLNEYFELMVEIVFRFEGTLDKFMGDGLMALWGVPVAHPDDPARAVLCALAMMEALVDFNRKRASRGIFPFEIGIGIHTGPLVAGYVGSSKALSYSVIGDTANTSARLCAIAAKGQILVGEATAAQLGPGFTLEELPPAQLKGKEHPVRLFNVRR